jgi:hypothetical protein
VESAGITAASLDWELMCQLRVTLERVLQPRHRQKLEVLPKAPAGRCQLGAGSQADR